MCHDAKRSRKPRTHRLSPLALALGVLAAVAGGAGGQARPAPQPAWPEGLQRFHQLSGAERLRLLTRAGLGDGITHKVAREVLTLTVTERGSLEAARSSDVVCTLKAPTKGGIASTVRWVIDDGSSVKKGDKVVELDSSGLQEQLKEQARKLEQAIAAHAKAREALQLIQSENEIDVRLAEIALRLAELRLKRDKGADRDLKEERLLLVEQARLGLDRVKARGRPKEVEARAEVQAKAAVVEQEKARKKDVEADLARCVLTAPQDGIVVYYIPEGVRGGTGSPRAIVAQGEPVREGQKLLQIPDLSQMQVVTRVHEALVSHLHAADPLAPARWQRAEIRVDAFPTRVLKGHVKTVDPIASQKDWFAADVKVYRTIVALDEGMDGLKPGMSVEVRITAGRTAGPVLQVPVQSLVAVGGKRFCFVVTDKEVQEREVVTGLTTDSAVEIRSGLKEGERVLLSPRAVARRLARWLDEGKQSGARKGESRRPAPAPLLVRSVKPADEGERRSWVKAYGLTHEDRERIASLPGVARAVPVRSFPCEAHRLHRVCTAQVVATTPAYADLNRLELAEGRFLNEEDDVHFRNVAVLGSGVAEQLFPGGEAIGATIVLSKSVYLVVGILGEVREAADPRAMPEADRGIYLPLRACRARFGERVLVRKGARRTAEAVPLHAILVTRCGAGDMEGTAAEIRELLEQSHPRHDWRVEERAGR